MDVYFYCYLYIKLNLLRITILNFINIVTYKLHKVFLTLDESSELTYCYLKIQKMFQPFNFYNLILFVDLMNSILI